MSLRAIHQRLFPNPAGGLLGEPTRLNHRFLLSLVVSCFYLFWRCLFLVVFWCRVFRWEEQGGEEVGTAKSRLLVLDCCLIV